ncbi:hypothetical protein E2C01_046044 [Portunus trituberculatus]|uniref:Uncharacterized protein n=1 Tax=Portunus trituberculatus TaxID=210409 RepID=A0A5B7FZW7_PORTR|nr:hypothetical protein [Portunus trituberculatus]
MQGVVGGCSHNLPSKEKYFFTQNYILLPHIHPSLKIQNKKMLTPNPALQSPSGEGARNVLRLDSSFDDVTARP